MRVEEHIQCLVGPFSELVPPPRQPFCLQPGHQDAVAQNARPEFTRRLRRGEEAHLTSYFVMVLIVWVPSLVIFGTLGGLIGRTVGGEPCFLAGLIGGALVLPFAFLCSGIAGLREVRRRAELYSRGQLLLGRVTGCTARDHYSNPLNPNDMPERTGAYVVTVWYCFQTPTGGRIEDKAQAIHQELPRPWPDGETAAVILYLGNDHYELL